MSALTVVTSDGDRRECAHGERVGIGGRGADITLAGDDSSNQYAHIECRDGYPWLVAAGPTVPVALNGRRVTAAVPVRDGDRIEIGERALSCALAEYLLTVRETAGALPADVNVPRPVSGRRRVGRGARLALLGLFAVLLAAASFVFTAVPVSVSVTPAPERLQLAGTLPVVQLRGRYLAFPGALVLVEIVRWNWPFGGVPIATLAMAQVAGPLAPTAE